MNEPRVFQDATFEEEVLKSGAPVLVDFSATWCAPCKMMTPVVEKLADELGERLVVGTIDVDDNPETMMRYNVRGVPTLAVFQDGQLVDRLLGYPGPGAVREFVEKHAAPVKA